MVYSRKADSWGLSPHLLWGHPGAILGLLGPFRWSKQQPWEPCWDLRWKRHQPVHTYHIHCTGATIHVFFICLYLLLKRLAWMLYCQICKNITHIYGNFFFKFNENNIFHAFENYDCKLLPLMVIVFYLMWQLEMLLKLKKCRMLLKFCF